ncbi:hypothetical protein SESBI_09697 [Sesbania bispinosa]|nr:hypothetical protein SESBI_09697 [Sesbania bispinosa]
MGEALGLLKEDLGVRGKVKLWWKKVGSRLDKGLRAFIDDKDVVELSTYAETHQCEVEVYVEHLEGGEGSVSLVSGIVQGTTGNANDGGVRIDGCSLNEINEVGDELENNVISDESVSDFHFDDSEEERILGMDDGFDKAEVGDAEAALNFKIENMLKSVGEGRHPKKASNPPADSEPILGLSQVVDTSSQNQTQTKPRGRPRGRNSQTELPKQQKAPTVTEKGGTSSSQAQSVKVKAAPNSSQTSKSKNKGKEAVTLPATPNTSQTSKSKNKEKEVVTLPPSCSRICKKSHNCTVGVKDGSCEQYVVKKSVQLFQDLHAVDTPNTENSEVASERGRSRYRCSCYCFISNHPCYRREQ